MIYVIWMRWESSHAFEDCGDTLAAPNAHGYQRVFAADALQLVERFHGYQCSGCPDRMSEPDGTAVRIGFLGVELQVARNGHRLHRERFVGFDDVHVLDLEAGILERYFGCGNEPDPHDFRVHACETVRNEPRHRLYSLLLRRAALHQHDGCRAVVDAGRVARGYRSVFLERGAQHRHAFEGRVSAPVFVFVRNARAFARLHLDRQNWLLEIVFVDRVDGGAVAFERELILQLARDFPFLGYVF